MQNILIYEFCPNGTTEACLEEVQKMLQRFVSPSRYKIAQITGQALRETHWEKATALLIIPGGRARLNYENIGEIGHRKIIEFVQAGGNFLGICAGAYYGSAKTVFEKGGDLEVLDEGPLYFYPGTAEGPVYGLGKFRYQCEIGARLSRLNYCFRSGENDNFLIYFNGGCYFHHQGDNLSKVLGKFDDIQETPAAIIECPVGEGRAILSGVHFEFSQPQCDKVCIDILGRLGVYT